MVNRNGELKLVIMTKDIFNEYFRIRKPNGEIDMEKEYFHVKNGEYYLDMILINELKKPAQVVCKCESINMPFLILRNGYDELYIMSYKEYLRRKEIIIDIKNGSTRCFTEDKQGCKK